MASSSSSATGPKNTPQRWTRFFPTGWMYPEGQTIEPESNIDGLEDLEITKDSGDSNNNNDTSSQRDGLDFLNNEYIPTHHGDTTNENADNPIIETQEKISGDPKKEKRIDVHGFQGRVSCKCDYASFVRAVDRILAVPRNNTYDYVVCVEIYLPGVTQKRAEMIKGRIFHNTKQPRDEVIFKFITEGVIRDAGKQEVSLWKDDRISCFVYFPEEKKPSRLAPNTADKKIPIIVLRQNYDDLDIYMKAPISEGFKEHFRGSQYIAEYQRALRMFYPNRPPHRYWQFQGREKAMPGWFDPPDLFWHDALAKGENPQRMKSVVLGRSEVPIYIPGIYDYYSQRNTFGVLTKEHLIHDAVGTSDEGFRKVWQVVQASNTSLKNEDRLLGLNIWISGERFIEIGNSPPQGCVHDINGNDDKRRLADWRKILNQYGTAKLGNKTHEMSIAVQPVFEKYTIKRAMGKTEGHLDLLGSSLRELRQFLSNCIYKQSNPNLTVKLTQESQYGIARPSAPFIIRHDTKPFMWEMIKRQITEPVLVVEEIENNTEWQPGEECEWGPHYDYDAKPMASWTHLTKAKPAIHGKAIDKLFSRSKINEEGRVEAAEHRQVHFDNIRNSGRDGQPVTTATLPNVTRPVIDLGATQPSMSMPPPARTMGAGEDIPSVTLGMRTASEMKVLERQVHEAEQTLKQQQRECPFEKCEKVFPYADGKGLDRHIKEDHSLLKCFLCDDDTLLPLYGKTKLREHFILAHSDELRVLFAGDESENDSDDDKDIYHCPNCGRDNLSLYDFADRQHHHAFCGNMSEDEEQNTEDAPMESDRNDSNRYCPWCGKEEFWGHKTSPCEGMRKALKKDKEDRDSLKKHSYCKACGFEYATMKIAKKSEKADYKKLHSRECKGLSTRGSSDSRCRYCGILLNKVPDRERDFHSTSCREKRLSELLGKCKFCQIVRDNRPKTVQIQEHFARERSRMTHETTRKSRDNNARPPTSANKVVKSSSAKAGSSSKANTTSKATKKSKRPDPIDTIMAAPPSSVRRITITPSSAAAGGMAPSSTRRGRRRLPEDPNYVPPPVSEEGDMDDRDISPALPTALETTVSAELYDEAEAAVVAAATNPLPGASGLNSSSKRKHGHLEGDGQEAPDNRATAATKKRKTVKETPVPLPTYGQSTTTPATKEDKGKGKQVVKKTPVPLPTYGQSTNTPTTTTPVTAAVLKEDKGKGKQEVVKKTTKTFKTTKPPPGIPTSSSSPSNPMTRLSSGSGMLPPSRRRPSGGSSTPTAYRNIQISRVVTTPQGTEGTDNDNQNKKRKRTDTTTTTSEDHQGGPPAKKKVTKIVLKGSRATTTTITAAAPAPAPAPSAPVVVAVAVAGPSNPAPAPAASASASHTNTKKKDSRKDSKKKEKGDDKTYKDERDGDGTSGPRRSGRATRKPSRYA